MKIFNYSNTALVTSNSNFKINFIALVKGNVFSNILPVLFLPLLTRLYSAESFGYLAVFLSIAAIISSFSTWRFERLVPNSSTYFEAKSLIFISFASSLIVSIIVFIAILLFGDLFMFINQNTASHILLLLPILIMGSATYFILESWFVFTNNLIPVSKFLIIRQIVNLVVVIFLGILSFDSFGLIVGSVLSSMVVFYFFLGEFNLNYFKRLLKISRNTFNQVINIFKDNFLVATQSSISSIFKISNEGLLQLLIFWYFGTVELGFYMLVQRVVVKPVYVITSSIAQSFWSEASKFSKVDPRYLKNLYNQVSYKLVGFSIFVSVIIVLLSSYVDLIFGEGWESTRYLFLAVIPWVFFEIISQSLSHLIIHRKQHWQMYLDIAFLIFTISVFLLSVYVWNNMLIAVISISLVRSLYYIVLYVLNLKCLNFCVNNEAY